MGMVISKVETDGKASSTGPLMREMVLRYCQDMLPYVHLSLPEVYDRIKALPYRPDPPDVETLMRPRYTMRGEGTGGDCDDKSIALASYCRLLRIPCRFVALRRPGRKNLHHVALECYLGGRWVFVDPTYSFNAFGRGRDNYDSVVIIGEAYP